MWWTQAEADSDTDDDLIAAAAKARNIGPVCTCQPFIYPFAVMTCLTLC